jgi:glycosyltransferase involved in cell wall biosynthesis
VITGTARRGAETFALDLAEALSERGRSGRVVALAPSPGTAGIDVPTLGRRPLGRDTLFALRREAGRAGVVVAHGSSTVLACAVATVGLRAPFVYRNIGDPTYWLRTSRRKRQMRWILRRARATVALWEDSAAVLRTLSRGRARIEIVPNGAPARRFLPADAKERRDARKQLGIGAGSLAVAYVGSLSPEKNVDVAIRAIAAIPEAEMIVIGDGAERARLEAIAASVAPGRVRFLGSQERPREELAAADVLVLPSETEGLPAALIEAGFMELPVVASAVGGIGEIVSDGHSGVLVPPRDPQALADGIRTAVVAGAAMGKAARRRCEDRFEIGVVAGAWERLLAELGAWSDGR